MKRWMPATSAGMASQAHDEDQISDRDRHHGLGGYFLSPFLVAGERRDILGVAQAAAIAARHASRSDLQAIADAHYHATRAFTDEFETWDTHQWLFADTRNDLLVSIHGILQVIRSRKPWTELKRKSFSENRRLHYCERHADVVAALQRRDADGAAAAMLGHIEAIEVALFGRR